MPRYLQPVIDDFDDESDSEEYTNDEPPIEPPNPLPPPPDKVFKTPEKALQYTKDWARKHGFAITKNRPYLDGKGDLTKYTIRCDRGGYTKSRSLGIRPTRGSKRCGCQFAGVITRVIRKNKNKPRWQYSTPKDKKTGNLYDRHNHRSSKPKGFHQYRKPIKKEEKIIKGCFVTRDAPADVVVKCKKWDKKTLITTKEVSNEYYRLRKEQLGGRILIEALLHELQRLKSKWVCRYKKDPLTGRIIYLFYAYKALIRLYRQNHELLLGDCTYKTNRYGMPLLHFLGVTSNEYFILRRLLLHA